MKPLHKRCGYCNGSFSPAREHAQYCSTACRSEASRARRLEFVVSPMSRKSTFSAERKQATGWGWMHPNDTYLADLRARRAANIPLTARESADLDASEAKNAENGAQDARNA